MPLSGESVLVHVNHAVVAALYLGENSNHPGYANVSYQGRTLIRRLLDAGTVPVIQTRANTSTLLTSSRADEHLPAVLNCGADLSESGVTVLPPVLVSDSVAPSTTNADSADNETSDNQTDFPINERFSFISQMVSMVTRGQVKSMIVTGSGGLGKTYTVMRGLEDAEMEEDIDYVLIKGYSTARSLFSRLFESSDKLIVFDDCDSILEDKTAVNILKSALDTSARRTVAWLSSNERDIPSVFTFTGRVIFISNKSISRIPQPLLSRSLFVDVTMTTDEKLERIHSILPKLKPGLSFEQKLEVFDLITRYKASIHDLNIRTFLKVCDIRESSNEEAWKRLATYILLTNSNAVDA